METTNQLSFASEASNCFNRCVAFFRHIHWMYICAASSARLTLFPHCQAAAPEAKFGFIVPFVARAVISHVVAKQIDRVIKK